MSSIGLNFVVSTIIDLPLAKLGVVNGCIKPSLIASFLVILFFTLDITFLPFFKTGFATLPIILVGSTTLAINPKPPNPTSL